MSTDWWSVLIQVAGIILSLIGGVGTVPLVNWLKGALNISGRWVQILTAAVAVLVATLTMLVSGAISPQPLTSDYVIGLFAAVLTASQAEYNRIARKEQAAYNQDQREGIAGGNN